METGTTLQRRRRPKRRVADERGRSTEQYSSKVLIRALNILDSFPDENAAFSLKEICSRNDLPESSAYRILISLQSKGYLVQASDGTYRLSPRVLYGKVREQAAKMADVARMHLNSLSARFDETASLAYLFEDRIQVLETVDPIHSMRLTNRPGRILPPHCSAMAKAITAFQTPEKSNRILEVYGLARRTAKTITDRTALFAEFARIRESGYAFDREEAVDGGLGIGAPICCEGQPVVAAISLSMPLVRFNPEHEKSMVADVVATAKSIASSLH